MKLAPLVQKMVAEFVGVTIFLVAIVSGGATFGSPAVQQANPLHNMVFAVTIGLMVLLVRPISGGHLNPAVSLYFFARKDLNLGEFFGYVSAQFLGGIAGVAIAEYLHGFSVAGFNAASKSMLLVPAGPAFVGEVLATAGLVWVFYTLIYQKQSQLVPFGVMLWVFAASQFTSTGAQANPAVTLGLMFSGRLTFNDGGMLVIAQLAGIVLAMAVIVLLTSSTAKKKAKRK